MTKIVSKICKSFFNYNIIDRVEAGIVLTGIEIKYVRINPPDLLCSYILLDKNLEAWIFDLRIFSNIFNHINSLIYNRPKKILLHKKELIRFFKLMKLRNCSIIPKKLYWKKNLLKIELIILKKKSRNVYKEKLLPKFFDKRLHIY